MNEFCELDWGAFSLDPSAIESDSIGPILEWGFAGFGRFGLVGRMGKFLKRQNFCLSVLLFWVVFSTFCGQKEFKDLFQKSFLVHMEKLHNIVLSTI